MFYCVTSTLLSLATAVSAAPTLYLVGDSTMAYLNYNGLQGWGEFISPYFSGLNIVNKAIIGESARSYIRDGGWNDVEWRLNRGDYVIIEFGHDESGSPRTSDSAPVRGEGEDTQTVTRSNGMVEVVYTWPHYMQAMIDGTKSKGATPIISSQTPNNPYDNSNTIINSPPLWVGYAQNVAAAKGVPYVNHFGATIQLYASLGKKTVDSYYYPPDHTHTNPAGAHQVAYAFMSGLKCPAAQNVLSGHFSAAGKAAGRRC